MSSKRYPEEFKIEAVKQITENRYPIAEVSSRLGVSQHSLYKWIKQYSQPESVRIETQGQQAELRRLKAELKRVTEERDILKNRPPGSPRPLCIETRGEYTDTKRGHWPPASWRFRPRQKTWPRGNCGPVCGGATW